MKNIAIALLSVVLSACLHEGLTNKTNAQQEPAQQTSQPEDKVFRLPKITDYKIDETISYVLSGTDNDGFRYTGSYSVVLRSNDEVSGAIYQLDTMLIIKDAVSGAIYVSDASSSYLDKDGATVYTEVSTSGISFEENIIATSPETAKVGDFGNLSTFTRSDGNSGIRTWRLDPGNTVDTANFTVATTAKDANGDIYARMESVTVINKNGDELAIEINISAPLDNFFVSLRGTVI